MGCVNGATPISHSTQIQKLDYYVLHCSSEWVRIKCNWVHESWVVMNQQEEIRVCGRPSTVVSGTRVLKRWDALKLGGQPLDCGG